ncbi:MAG: hypothetical protein K8R54_04120 [Bacteroidales bacterium]|nr:hypothetical protein [Bacteroidales bacterium]
MKKIITIMFALLISFAAFSQKDGEKKFGADKTHFVHPYLSLGFMTPPTEGEGADILYGKSHIITYGVRYKLKLADFFALGAGINYTYQAWHMDQVDTKIIPTPVLYDKEKILSNNLGGDIFLRINIGKRTNTIGNYIDLGGYGEWAYNTKRKITNYFENPDIITSSQYGIGSYIHLNYMKEFNYGLETRIAYGRYVIFGKYRMSDLFTQDFKDVAGSTELPRLVVGIEVGFHK